MVGHNSKIPLVGLVWQSLLPPPQLGIPDDPTRLAPINTTTVPWMQIKAGEEFCAATYL